ncbi:type I glyceraldehyde-3-phosphate dehydrogenase, partial [Acaryochloris sp. IP29b_bin.137]|uniref:type I glyceraldehyde-3-phosphate dehydrogenase n=1 Tax=Acaryochloris sp. IP29b_bin.137 TaxID=2969217 RepID=UPI0026321D47
DPKTNAHLLTYDSMLGRLDADIKAVDNTIVANGKVIKCVSDRNPSNLPWADWDIDMVIESTGVFVTKEGAGKHLEAGAKKVLITAPGKGGVGMYVVGVNHETYDPSEAILSNASCTTNCLAPVVKILHEQFGIKHGLMTTTHSYTGDQRILDASHRDLRRARAAAVNIVPTSTGAAKAVGTVIPALAGKLNGIALRVPTPNVSVCDFVAQTEKPAIAESVNEVLKQASEGSMKGIIAFNEEPLVSGDFKGHDCSSIVDGSLTMGMGGNMIKVVAWYDNEWGYSQRVLDLAEYVAQKW